MSLCYRGRNYEISSLWDVVEGELTGKYRGANWIVCYPRHIPQLQQLFHLKYRGLNYSHNCRVSNQEHKPTESLVTRLDAIALESAKINKANICRT